MAKQTKTKAFTVEELKTLEGIFQRVWQYIASDALQIFQEQEGRAYMTKNEVIEMVLDAGRPEEQCKSPEEKKLVERFMQLELGEQERLARMMFKATRYGM